MNPEPSPSRVSICTTAGLTASATAATGSDSFSSTTGVEEPAPPMTSPALALLFGLDSVDRANAKPASRSAATATAATAARRPRPGREEPEDEGGQGGAGGGGGGGGGGGTADTGAVIGAHVGGSPVVAGSWFDHSGGRIRSQSISLIASRNLSTRS